MTEELLQLSDWHRPQQPRPREDDLESVSACSVIADIPPPPAPVQSHALLEEGLGLELPRTPMLRQSSQKWSSRVTPTPPPTLPRNAAQRRPGQLTLQRKESSPSASAAYAGDAPHAHGHRASLMSTGSSENITENSSESSLTSNPGSSNQPTSPNEANQDIFTRCAH